MAGMFSLLNNNLRTEGGQTLPINSSRDEANLGKNTPRSRTPVMNRRKLMSDRNVIKYTMGGDKLPKSMRKQRIEELHPILRRSVCTLLIAGLVMTTGVIFILVDLFDLHSKTSVRGLVLLITGFVLVIIGLIWLKCSQKKLDALNARTEQTKLKKKKLRLSSSCEVVEAVVIPIVPSKHAIKWPTRMDCDGDNCRETITSPNGNHIMAKHHHHSCSDSDGESCANSYRVPETAFPFQNNCDHNYNQSVDYPMRIGRNGKFIDVSNEEKCASCVVFHNSVDDLHKTIEFVPSDKLLSC